MVKKGAQQLRPIVHEAEHDDTWNIVELESRRQLRRAVQMLIDLTNSHLVTTSEIQHYLSEQVAVYGALLGRQLARALRSDDEQKRQSAVWLLTLLNEVSTIPLLQQMSQDRKLARLTRLAAALALAGMCATDEVTSNRYRERLYA